MRWILAVLTGLLVTAVLTGWGHAQRPLRGREDDAARHAVQALAAAQAPVPAKRHACSSPFGGTWYGFDAACARHDAGYDLLRRAADRGHPLGPWARRTVDARFAADLASTCRSTGCLLTSAVYVGAVRVNSWRQGDGVPVVERRWVVALASLAGLGAAALVAARRRRPGLPLVAAGAGLAAAAQPTTLPHPLWVGVVIGGLVAAQAWAAGVLVRRLARRAVRAVRAVRAAAGRHGIRPALPVHNSLITTVVGVGFAVAAGHAYAGQVVLATSMGSTPPSLGAHLLGLTGGAALAALLILGCRAGARVLRRSAVRLAGTVADRRAGGAPGGGRRPALRRVVLASVAVPAALLPGCGTVTSGPPVAGSTAAPADADGAVAVSTDPAGWDAAGPEARAFVAGAGGALRVYAPRAAAADQRTRAELAVRALDRAGGFDRAVVLVAVPTGSGWVNPEAPAALEQRRHGDVATVAVQYAASPSWVAFLRGGEGVDTSVRALFAALERHVATMPADRRPRLLAYGESLGAWGGLRSARSDDGLPPGADGALWTGIPAGSPTTTRSGGRAEAEVGAGAEVGAVELTHRDDPVAAWSPALLVRPNAAWHHAWLPVLSFWQATADVIAARDVPAGHGHRYEGELGPAWDQVLARVTVRP